MPSSAVGLLVVFVAVLPGALYIWAFEREVGRWGIGLADRVLRFIGVSALFLAFLAYPIRYLWVRYLHVLAADRGDFKNLVVDGGALPWWLLVVPLAYVGAPVILGTLAATAVRRDWRAARILVGPDPAPRAWDALFSPRPAGVVRVRLQDDLGWVGGLFGAESYAAGYPEQPQDLYLESAYQLLDDGSFALDDDGDFVELGSGLLLRWEDVLHLEFFAEPVEGLEEVG
jgi:Family of unknown function (DUF6338)